MLKNFILPVSLMVGAIIGAGIFSLPFVFSQSGIITGIFYLALLTAIATIIHLLYADIILKDYSTPHRFPGYAKMHLGNTAGAIANAIIFTQLLLVMTIYLILSISFLNLLFPSWPILLKIGIFWILGSAPIFLTAKKEAIFEAFTSIATVLIILIIFFMGIKGLLLKGQIPAINWQMSFLPFGPILFSLLGEAAIAPVIVYFKGSGADFSKIKRVLVWGTIIPALLYLAFTLGILGITPQASPDAVSGLIGQIPVFLLALLGIFGFVSLWDSYVTIGADLRKILEYDWSLPKILVGLIIIPLPLIFYAIGLQNFIALVSLVGGILFSVWAIFIILIWKKISKTDSPQSLLKKISPFILVILLLVFLSAIAYEVINFIT